MPETTPETPIEHVSDTALWVAYYRVLETERPDALFKDSLAKKLLGERGEKIAKFMDQTAAYTQQNVIIRTYIIDRFIEGLVANGVDMVINLGAGLDTRPYRLKLPEYLRWVEVDYPHMMEMKTTTLATDKPVVALERVSLDLADLEGRRKLFARLAGESRRAVILTEGVLPYLSQDAVSALAADLHAHSQFEFWICDYMAKETYKYIKDPKRMVRLKNAPFQFFPDDWFGFFKARGWDVDNIQYIQQTTVDLKRPMPMPLIARLLAPFFPPKVRARFLKMSGYMILKRT
jgi:methyltransferase (TIGR00027 family)